MLLQRYGAVVIERLGSSASDADPLESAALAPHRDNIWMTSDPVVNNVSSSLVRRLLREGLCVQALLAPAVEQYIRDHGLYTGNSKHAGQPAPPPGGHVAS